MNSTAVQVRHVGEPASAKEVEVMYALLGTTVGMIWLTAKIYRVGILMYGKRPSLGEVVRWMRRAR